MVQLSRSARRSVEKAAQTKYVTPAINSKRKYEKISLRRSRSATDNQNLVILRSCFGEGG